MRAFLLALVLLTLPVLSALPGGAAHAAQKGYEWGTDDALFLTGQEVTFSRKTDRGLNILAETVILTPDADVDGGVWIAARRVAMSGKVDGDVSIRSQDALINGEIDGTVTFYGSRLTLGPDARIDGDVNYYAASRADIDPGAEISGKVSENAWSSRKAEPRAMPQDRRLPREWEERSRSGWSAPGYRVSAGGAVVFGILAALFALLAPEGSARLRDGFTENPLLAFLLGLAWIVGVPVLAVAVALTIIGIPAAFILILLWPLGVIAGFLTSIVAAGAFIWTKLGAVGEGALGRVIGVAIATFVFWIALSMPIAGGLFWLAIVTAGIGSIVLGMRQADLP
ncbi:cytoskeletal protein CcmA (bactofilin family) [Parvibaculum indicum]|uniref:polymer-forming cytoskeletal protein n=1 Tax=Parvibaculum indicum TaxID=562969 RepID=UPI00141F42D1|nr:polymer-forming cytoskeletal protein [Parvibaculum indicum]NIJ40085.1 cytoskeletal protein CcmA (bactofilin family) [Parvibaculum indicum]